MRRINQRFRFARVIEGKFHATRRFYTHETVVLNCCNISIRNIFRGSDKVHRALSSRPLEMPYLIMSKGFDGR